MTKSEDFKEGLVILGGIIFWVLVAFMLMAPMQQVGWFK
jgi:hypothetical protein